MRVLVQRVSSAEVRVQGKSIGKIGAGLLVFVAIRSGDTVKEFEWMAEKLSRLRILEDKEGKMNYSILDMNASILVVSQFTLYGDATHGNRPSFTLSEKPELARASYELFVSKLREKVGNDKVQTGEFQAAMEVQLTNDGPVTIMLERDSPG